MQIEIDPFEIDVDADTKMTTFDIDAQISFSWRDDRLFHPDTNPCLGIVSGMITLSAEEADSDITKVDKASYRNSFWMPTSVIEPVSERKDLRGLHFQLSTSPAQVELLHSGDVLGRAEEVPRTFVPSPSHHHNSPDWPTNHTVMLQVKEKHNVKQMHFDYYYYPFDCTSGARYR